MPSSLPSSPDADFEHIFDLAPVSLWLKDYSVLKQLFARWRSEGVQDIAEHVRNNPSCLRQYSHCLKVIKVNQRTLELFAAPDQATLEASLGQVFRDDMHEQALPEILQLWSGATEFSNQAVNYTLDGRRLGVQIRGRILPGHEDDWSRVLVSLEDHTAQHQASRALKKSELYARGLFENRRCRCGCRTSARSSVCWMTCFRRAFGISRPSSKCTRVRGPVHARNPRDQCQSGNPVDVRSRSQEDATAPDRQGIPRVNAGVLCGAVAGPVGRQAASSSARW